MRRHAEALGQWLEPEVKRSPFARRALLAGVVILVVTGAYLALRGIAEAVGTSGTDHPATAQYYPAPTPAATASGLTDHPVPRDSGGARVATPDMNPRPAHIVPPTVSSTAPSVSSSSSAAVSVARPVAPSPEGGSTGVVRGMVVPGTPPPALAPAVMEMMVTPWAIVTIDGRVLGVRARGINALAAGVPHRLRFEREGYVTIDTTVMLRAGERRALDIQMSQNVVDSGASATTTVRRARPLAPGVVQMLITPWASVSIDGRAAVRRARGADTLTAGVPHRLRFERPGFATVDTTVTLQPGEFRVLEIQMTPTRP